MTYSPERGWLLTLVTTSTAGTLQNYTYTRDGLGRINAVASPQAGDSWTYGYDGLDRLLAADNATDNSLDQTFTYDLVGNMATNSKVGTYGYGTQGSGSVRPHATTGLSGGPLGSQSFFYDANGSMTCQGGSGPTCPGGDNRRDYDGENRLVTAVDGAYTTSITYGPDGARLKKAVAASGGGTTTTLYFGDDVELTAGQYLKYLPGDVKKTGSGPSGTLYWQHRDHLQSVRVVTKTDGSKDDGAVYRPYGEQLGFAGTTPQTKGFIGQRLDERSGLMYLHARYYDPVLGRFIQADPSDPTKAGVGVNRYTYAGDNPIAYLDPSGLAGIGDNGGPPLIDPMIGEGQEFDDGAETNSVIMQQEHHFDRQLDRLLDQERRALLGMVGDVLIHNAQVRAAEAAAAEARLTAAEDAIAAKSPAARATARATVATATERVASQPIVAKVLELDAKKYPLSSANLINAKSVGVPLPVNRAAAAANRAAALKGKPKVPLMDLDEAPPAFLRNPGDPVAVTPTPRPDNRGSGAVLGNQARDVRDGEHVVIEIKNRGRER